MTELEHAAISITIWSSNIGLRPPVNRNVRQGDLLEAECYSSVQIKLSSDFPICAKKNGISASTYVANSTKPLAVHKANSKYVVRGLLTPRTHAIHSELGL